MEFASRYELEDPLLTTAVETFCATDRQTHQRVLVHVFPAADHGLTAASSPDEVGLRFLQVTNARVVVRNAGVDRVTGYAFVVTEEIAKEVIEGWASGPAARTGTEKFNTAEFLRSMNGVPPEPAPSAGPAPGAFTREFMSLGEDEPKPPVNAPASAPAPGAFTRMFFSDVSPAGSAGKTPDPRSASEDTTQLLPESPTPMSARAQQGAFTRMFGQSGAPVAPEPQQQQPGPFTRMFQNGDGAGTSSPPTKPTPPVREPATPMYQHPQPASPEPVRPAPVAPARPAAAREPATGFFSEDRARVPRPVAPAGPSDYTKVIAAPSFARPASPPAPPAPVNAPPVAPPPAMPAAMPPPPPVQGYPAPPYPAAPAPPPYTAPAPPPYAAPAPAPYAVPAPPAPQPPAAPHPAAPSRSWMPFIILINVLFLIAILLIVVFALKGH